METSLIRRRRNNWNAAVKAAGPGKSKLNSSTAETSCIKVIRPIYWLKLELVRVEAKTPSLTEITYARFSCTLYVEMTIHYRIELADNVSFVISMGLDLNSKNQLSSQYN